MNGNAEENMRLLFSYGLDSALRLRNTHLGTFAQDLLEAFPLFWAYNIVEAKPSHSNRDRLTGLPESR